MELAALSRSAAEQRCRELGLATTGTGRDCRQRLADYFSHAPREVIPITPKAASLKLYKRALWVLDHIPWEKITTKATGSQRAVAAGNQSISLGRTVGVWGVSHDIIKKKYDPITRALLQVLWDTLAEMAGGFQYSTCHINKIFSGKPHVDRNNEGMSWALSLGDFTGGELVCEVDDPRVLHSYNTRRRPVVFDGHRPHWVTPYEGTRYSVILYTSKHATLKDASSSSSGEGGTATSGG